MRWKIEFTETADKQLSSLDKTDRERIRHYVKDIEKLPNPRMRGEPLVGNLAELWKYRVGKYRIICRIKNEALQVLVVKIGKRDKVYK